jgi:hypothetical protein
MTLYFTFPTPSALLISTAGFMIGDSIFSALGMRDIPLFSQAAIRENPRKQEV